MSAPPDATTARPALPLDRLTHALPVLLSYVDREERYRFTNDTYSAWFGRPAAWFEGRHMSEVLGAEAFERLRPRVLAALRGERVTFETVVHYEGIGRRHMRVTYIPDRDGEGVVQGFTACIEDVTERMAAEEELRRIAEERDAALRKLEAVLELLPTGVILSDREGTRANAEMARILGLDPQPRTGALLPVDPVCQEQLHVYRDGKRIPAREFPARRAWKTGAPTPLVALEAHRPDGAVVHVTGAAAPLRDAAGAVVGSVACYTDVTALRREEAEVRRRESFLRLLADAVPGFIWALEPDGTPMYSSSALDAYLGDSLVALGRDRLTVAIHPDDAELAATRMATHLGAGEPFELEFRLRRHDGVHRTFLHRALPEKDATGAIVRWVGLSLDVTDRLEAEASLRRAEQLQAVGTLAGGVAHEVNNQMSIVVGFGELALRKLGAGPAARDVSHMLAAGQRAANVSQQLLAFSRRQVLAPAVLDLHEVLVAFSPVLARLLGADKRLALALAPREVHIVADRAQLEQVLVNLTANARDAMPGGGVLTLGTRAAAEDGHAELYVRDTGVGMSAEVRARAFEPFFTTKPLGAGSGLGLPTVYGIVTQSGGRVELQSAPGAGTTVRLLLPSAPSPEREDTGPGTFTMQRRTGVVVLAEDEPGLRELLTEVLGEAGFEVVAAGDGASALDAALALPAAPTLLLTDLVMPGLNGRALAERVREKWPVPVLYTSGYAGEDALRRGLMDDSAAFLQKPFTPSELLAAVERILAAG